MYQGVIEHDLLINGYTLFDFTPREICNIVYGHIVQSFQPPMDDDDASVEEQIQIFEESIGLRMSAETKAEKMMRANMLARGLDPDAIPELSPELKAKMEADAMKDMSDKDLFFSGKAHDGREFMGQRLNSKDTHEWE